MDKSSPYHDCHNQSLLFRQSFKARKEHRLFFSRKSQTFDERRKDHRKPVHKIGRTVTTTKCVSKNSSLRCTFDKSILLANLQEIVPVKIGPELDAIKTTLLKTETFRLQIREIACASKPEGELKKLAVINKIFETVAQLTEFPFNTTGLQIKGYEVIGDILAIYKDYKSAAIYYCKGVLMGRIKKNIEVLRRKTEAI